MPISRVVSRSVVQYDGICGGCAISFRSGRRRRRVADQQQGRRVPDHCHNKTSAVRRLMPAKRVGVDWRTGPGGCFWGNSLTGRIDDHVITASGRWRSGRHCGQLEARTVTIRYNTTGDTRRIFCGWNSGSSAVEVRLDVRTEAVFRQHCAMICICRKNQARMRRFVYTAARGCVDRSVSTRAGARGLRSAATRLRQSITGCRARLVPRGPASSRTCAARSTG